MPAEDVMIRRFISVDINDTVSQLLAKMKRNGQSFAVVNENGKYRGLVSKKWLVSSRIDSSTMKVRNIVKHRSKAKTPFFVPKLSKKTKTEEICRLISDADVRALPVIEGNKAIGVVRAIDVLKEIRPNYKGVKAQELATMKLITINQNEETGKAIKQMNRKNIDRLVVIDSAGRLIGIVSLVDILEIHVFPRRGMKINKGIAHTGLRAKGQDTGEKQDLLKLPVSNILTANCCTAKFDSPMALIIDEMINNDVSSIVLLKDKKPAGIITVKDILSDFGGAI